MTRSDADRFADRNTRIWKAYIAGATQETIAAEHGITRERVSQILTAIRATIPDADRAHLVQRETEFLDDLRAEVLDLWRASPIPAYSNGKPIMSFDGQTVAEDHSGRLAALDRAVRLHERLSKLLGLDAAAKQDVTVTTAPEDIELVQRIREWKASRGQGPDTASGQSSHDLE